MSDETEFEVLAVTSAVFSLRSAVVLLMLSWPTAVPAQALDEASTSSMQDARALIARGIELRKRGDDRQALVAFEQAWALSQSTQALAQLALAEQALGRWLDAHQHLEEALQHGEDTWIAEHRATLDTALEEIASRLGSLEVTCNVSSAEIRVDGRVLGRTPLQSPVRVVAGQSVIQVSAPGYLAITRHVHVDAQNLARVDISLTEAPSEGASPPSPNRRAGASVAAERPSERGPAARDVLLYTSLGLTALGAAVGVTGYVMREVNVSLYNDDTRCDVWLGIRRSDECPDEAAAWRRGESLAIGGFAAGGVFGATALYLWLARPAAEEKRGLACGFGPSSVTCHGAF